MKTDLKHQIVNHTFEIDIIDNPRKPNGDMGASSCHLCGSRSSALVRIIMAHYEGPPQIVLCKGCLDQMDKLINFGILREVRSDNEHSKNV